MYCAIINQMVPNEIFVIRPILLQAVIGQLWGSRHKFGIAFTASEAMTFASRGAQEVPAKIIAAATSNRFRPHLLLNAPAASAPAKHSVKTKLLAQPNSRPPIDATIKISQTWPRLSSALKSEGSTCMSVIKNFQLISILVRINLVLPGMASRKTSFLLPASCR